MSTPTYTDITTTDLGNGEHEVRATIPADTLSTYRERALKDIGKNTEVPGFRKGHVPEDLLVGHVGESRVMERAANLALAAVFPEIVQETKLRVIGAPQVAITKLAKDNPLEFTATVAVMPEVTLPKNYQSLAAEIFTKEETLDVSDDEVHETLAHIRRQRAQIESFEKQKADGVEKPEMPELADEDLPELTDDFVKTLGDFASVDAFTQKVRENILEEKKLRDTEKKRIEAVERILEKTQLALPTLLINQEVARIQAQLEADLKNAGLELNAYLAQVGKTLEELQKEWRPEGEKRAKLQLVLNTIAAEHDIAPEKEAVEREVEHVKTHHPDADEAAVRAFVTTTTRNQAVLAWLENTKKH